MLMGLPIIGLGFYLGYKKLYLDQNNENKSDSYNDLFKNMGLLKTNEWVKLKNTKREKAYNLFQFEICDSVSVQTFIDNVDYIAEKIGAKDRYINRLEVYYDNKLMNFKIKHATIPTIPFKPIKIDDFNKMLVGHDYDYNPVFSTDINLLVCGITGSGKSTIINTIIINLLHNQQGLLYLGDLKKTEFWDYRNKEGVVKVAEEMQDVEQLIGDFKSEYERRCKVLRSDVKQYRNYIEYNQENEEQLKPYFLIIDEFADIALKYIKRDEPFGIYKDIIESAAKIRFTGGRIILGTQRPSVDIIKGILKNNFNLLGMRTINEINSKIVIDEPGLEELENFQAKIRLDGKIVDVLSYYLDEKMIRKEINKLENKKVQS